MVRALSENDNLNSRLQSSLTIEDLKKGYKIAPIFGNQLNIEVEHNGNAYWRCYQRCEGRRVKVSMDTPIDIRIKI